MIQINQDIINGIGGGAGGLGIGGLVVWLLTKYGFPGSKKNGSKCAVIAEQVDEIHSWFGDRGPMDRMTTQMEAVVDNTKETTGVLEKILVVLEKK